MSIEKALKDHTTALNRFVDFCEKYGVIPAEFNAVKPLRDSAPVVSDEIKAPVLQATGVAPQVTGVAPQVSDEPTAPVAPEVNAPEESSIEAGLWIPMDEERAEDSDVAEAETPVTIADLKACISQLLPDKKKIIAVLDQLGVSKITELKAEDLPKAKQLFDKAIQGA